MYLAKIFITGAPPRSFTSKNGKQMTINNVFVYTDSAPFPVEVGVFDDINLSRGNYNVPFELEVYQGRLNIRFDFNKAEFIAEK